MLRISICLAAMLLVVGTPHTASAQTTTPEAKPSRMKLTTAKLKEMKAKWVANKPKFKACRAEVRKKGLVGDDRWFYMEDCMDKT